MFESLPVKVPYNYAKILSAEYGNRALTKIKHRGYRFDSSAMAWVEIQQALPPTLPG